MSPVAQHVPASPRSYSIDNDVDFASLVPVFEEFARLPEHQPRRAALRERLIVGHLPLAHYAATRYARSWVARDDLVQVATVGVINAVDRYDPFRGSSFLSFAVPTVTGEVRRYFRDHGWSLHMPRRLQDLHRRVAQAGDALVAEHGHAPTTEAIATYLGVTVVDVDEAREAGHAARALSLDHPLGPDTDSTYAEMSGELDGELTRADARETVRPLLRSLTPTERKVLYLRFFEDMSQSRIGREVGYSQMHISRLLSRILGDLQERAAAS